MRIIGLFAAVFIGFISAGADAENLRHNSIRNIQQQLRQLPALVPTATVPSLPLTQPALPPLIEKPQPPIIVHPEVIAAPEVPATPALMPIQAESKPIANMSPKTKTLLTSVGAGIGSDKSEPQKITIEQGGFVQEAEVSAVKGKGEFEEVGDKEEKKKAGFEIEVSSKAPAFGEYETLKKAQRAVEVEQYESAIALYNSVLAQTPDNRDAMFGLATAYQKAGRKTRAKEIYAQLLEKHPDYRPALNNLLAMAAAEAPERALADFAAIEGRNPNFAGVYAQKAKIYRDTLNLPLAVKNLSKALALEPENQNYRYDLAIVADENQDYVTASKYYAELIDLANNGVKIPADKDIITERMNYIGGL